MTGKRPRIGWPTQGPTPSAYLRPRYPLAGCSPAEPTSVSPGGTVIPRRTLAGKSDQRLRVRKTYMGVAKDRLFFVQRMGSTSASDIPDQHVQDRSCRFDQMTPY